MLPTIKPTEHLLRYANLEHEKKRIWFDVFVLHDNESGSNRVLTTSGTLSSIGARAGCEPTKQNSTGRMAEDLAESLAKGKIKDKIVGGFTLKFDVGMPLKSKLPQYMIDAMDLGPLGVRSRRDAAAKTEKPPVPSALPGDGIFDKDQSAELHRLKEERRHASKWNR